jgi:mRNA interferase YafQ
MPLLPSYTKQFEKDLKLALKRGKDPDKIKRVITKIINQEPLETKYRDHKLVGNYMGRRDCHIEPDWLLIYKPEPESNRVIFERTGTHSDLFR